MENFSELTTEKINLATAHIDECSTLEVIKIINDEDKKVATDKFKMDIAELIFIP